MLSRFRVPCCDAHGAIQVSPFCLVFLMGCDAHGAIKLVVVEISEALLIHTQWEGPDNWVSTKLK